MAIRLPVLDGLRKSRMNRMWLLCIVQCRGFSLLFSVIVFQSTIQCLLNLIFHSHECYVLDVHPWEAAFFRHHEGITDFSHTFTSARQQRQCRGSSLSPQHLSFTSGKLILQYLIDTSQISNLPYGFAQCTKAACGSCATYLFPLIILDTIPVADLL
jgi:hypothetical protein